jgi:hypothetical protein
MNKTQTYSPSHIATDARFRERFQYWIGWSNRRYIFSIYSPQTCPPLPGAVYLAVRREADGSRTARSIGRFPRFWDSGNGYAASLLRQAGGDEIHVHLLAETEEQAEAAVCDLKAALAPAVRLRQPDAPHARRQRPSARSYAGPQQSCEQIDMFGCSTPSRGRASV